MHASLEAQGPSEGLAFQLGTHACIVAAALHGMTRTLHSSGASSLCWAAHAFNAWPTQDVVLKKAARMLPKTILQLSGKRAQLLGGKGGGEAHRGAPRCAAQVIRAEPECS
jgi:hypothetical protein